MMEDPRNLVDGQWRAPSGAAWPVLDPASGQTVAMTGVSTPQDVDDAVGAARAALPAWRSTTPGERAGLLMRLTELVRSRFEELVDLEVTDTGKPISAFRDDEMHIVLDAMSFFASAGRFLEAPAAGEYITGRTALARREPVGVVAAVTPWNFPLLQAVLKVMPALAAGNTVVLKPAEDTPLSSTRLVALAAELLPTGVLNLVLGPGQPTGSALVAHPDVDLVSFTGSVAAGRAIARAAGDRLARLVLELGGNAPAVLLDDADLGIAVPGLVETALGNAGQDCTASSRWLVPARHHDEIVATATELMAAWRLGSPREEKTQLGPMISAAQRDRVRSLLAEVPGHVRHRVRSEAPDQPGFYLSPSLLTGLRQDDVIVQREIFGPVVTVQTYDTAEQALAMANDTPYGLAASVWTRDLGRGLSFARDLEVGSVWVNDHTLFSPDIPQGGFGDSGYGKENGLAGVEEFTRVKSVSVNLGS